ncbi:MAG TPA: hypothetical protein VEG42_04995 [Thermoplasmata archaeon]|nr:hypothetical protein [Thermoplasmata archaeon]
MDAPPRRIAWISPPPQVCWLCKEPLGDPNETSSWNGNPAHRDCVRIHLLQRDPAFRESGDPDEAAEEMSDPLDEIVRGDDDESEFN